MPCRVYSSFTAYSRRRYVNFLGRPLYIVCFTIKFGKPSLYNIIRFHVCYSNAVASVGSTVLLDRICQSSFTPLRLSRVKTCAGATLPPDHTARSAPL